MNHSLCWDTHIGEESAFPANAAVPYEAIRRAIHEFYDLDAAGLPRAVNWQQAPEIIWGP